MAGTSAGALISLMLTLGMTSHEMETWACEKITEMNAHQLDVDVEDVLDLYTSMGLDKGWRIGAFLNNMMVDRLERYRASSRDQKTPVTFEELHHATGKTLIVCASNLTTASPEYFSHITTPHISVVTAIRASMCLPVFFAPVVINNMMYSDGGIFDNLPVRAVLEINGTKKEDEGVSSSPFSPVLAMNIPWCLSSQLPSNIVNYATYLVTSLLIRANNTNRREDFTDTNSNAVRIVNIDNQEQAHPFFGFRLGLDDSMEFVVDKKMAKRYAERGYGTLKKALTT